jgi:hypothetical protein
MLPDVTGSDVDDDEQAAFVALRLLGGLDEHTDRILQKTE